MSVFRSNQKSSGSVLPAHVVAERRAAQAARHRDLLARQRAAAIEEARLANIARYEAILAAKAANNGIPPVLANALENPNLTAFERAGVEDTIAAIVQRDRVSIR